MYDKLLNFTYRMEQNRLFASIKKGLLMLIPVLVTGSVALMFKSLPNIDHIASGVLLKLLNLIYDATFGMMAVYLCCGISYSYAATFESSDETFSLMAMMASLGSFLASFGEPSGMFQFINFGAVGVFTAIFCSVFATMLFYFFVRHLPLIFRSYAAGVDRQFRVAVSMIVPLFLCVLVFSLMSLAIQAFTGKQNMNLLLSDIVIRLFQNLPEELVSGLLFVTLLDGLWFFGMHGGNVMEQVAQSYFVPANTDPSVIVSKSFLDNFALIGGCGTTFCLLLALILFSKNANNRKLAWSAAPFAIFNMNELIVFGLPVILNPMMLIPFLLTPAVCLIISYIATKIGFLPVVTTTVTWTTPVLFSGYAATKSLHGVLVQLISLTAGVFLYMPFIRLSERMQEAHEKMLLDDLAKLFWKGSSDGYLGRSDHIGVIAKAVTSQLRDDVSQGKIPIYFQPQVNSQGKIIGAEALLRWQYHGYNVPPPITVALAQEDGIFDEMTTVILTLASDAAVQFLKNAESDFVVSANITARQLNNASFVSSVIGMVEQKNIQGNFCLEITEEDAIEQYSLIEENLGRLRKAGISTAIDDFSMGHTSLKYLQHNDFQFVKLDGSLVRKLHDNQRCQDIVRSIIKLGDDLHFSVVAEYVENDELQKLLESIGCHIFQGYLYSPAVPLEKFLVFLRYGIDSTEP